MGWSAELNEPKEQEAGTQAGGNEARSGRSPPPSEMCLPFGRMVGADGEGVLSCLNIRGKACGIAYSNGDGKGLLHGIESTLYPEGSVKVLLGIGCADGG